MFGNVVANFEDLNEEESARYQALYCGLCDAIKDRYGQLPRVGLSFDLTFVVMVLNSMYEPTEEVCKHSCIMHPVEKREFIRTEFSDYAADLTVLLTYHKCLDDWLDDKKLSAQGMAQLLKKSYKKACERIPHQAEVIERMLAEIQVIEKRAESSLDDAAHCFGVLMGELMSYRDDMWADQLRKFGHELGRFIYAMDAAIDREKDAESGSYNPFIAKDIEPATIKTMLMVLIGRASEAFEKLPLVQDIRLLRSVLYAGVWQQYTMKMGENHG